MKFLTLTLTIKKKKKEREEGSIYKWGGQLKMTKLEIRDFMI